MGAWNAICFTKKPKLNPRISFTSLNCALSAGCDIILFVIDDHCELISFVYEQ